MVPLILASTSPYRRELLERLAIPFSWQKPLFDEENAKGLAMEPEALCQHLGREKAKSLMTTENCCIGGDQMLVLENQVFGKPGTAEKAFTQLQRLSGKSHRLLTSVTVYYQGKETSFLDITTLQMRQLSDESIRRYLDLDKPFDCAGSYKIEKHGISLFEKIESEDFTAIQGLPLVRLGNILRQYKYSAP